MSPGKASANPSTPNRGTVSERAPTSLRHPLARALLVLTCTSGLIDAACYLGIGHVFTANMTGNVVFLGFGFAGAGGLPVGAPMISLAAFLVGAGAGGVLASRLGDSRARHIGSALAIECLLVGAAAVFAAVINVRPNAVSGDLVIGVLALAMGVRNATVRKLGVPDLTTTVVTMTLTGLAADSPLFGGSGKGTARRSAAVLAMFAGALAGALLLKTSLTVSLAAAAVLPLIALLVYMPAARRGA